MAIGLRAYAFMDTGSVLNLNEVKKIMNKTNLSLMAANALQTATHCITKRHVCTLAAALFAMIWAAESASAQRTFAGILRQSDQPISVELVTSATNGGLTAVTVSYLKKREVQFDFASVAAGASGFAVEEERIPRGTKRMIVEVDLPTGGTALLKIRQGVGLQFDFPMAQGSRFVFDVVTP